MRLPDLRKEYGLSGLHERDVDPDPVRQFGKWFDDAVKAKILQPDAVTLATATPNGIPSARVILLKEFDDRGFVFHTNYESQKGKELELNPQAALVFWWAELERQVRISGTVEKISPKESDVYFRTRPRGAQIGAWASRQSEVIKGNAQLIIRFTKLLAKYAFGEVPRPSYWGGYRIIPFEFEFWQGRPNRLHDRLRYRKGNGKWILERLSP